MPSITRRTFSACVTGALLARAQARAATVNNESEWAFSSGKQYRDPFNEVELDVIFQRPDKTEQRVPAFWAGENTWRVRYSPPLPGKYTWHTVATDTANRDLHGLTGTLEAAPYKGTSALHLHGPIRVAADHRHFEHADGTPFLWLGDTWWMGLTQRLSWPDDFQALTADRVQKGFNVVQIVAGLYPDMPEFDARGANENGFPWERDYTRINPSYFDMADLRIRYLVANGISPCIVASWGYYLPILGLERMKKHWRYLVARWSALPVTWCLAGEGTMPYYLSKTQQQDKEDQKQGWTEIARYVRGIDPGRHIMTIHPSSSARVTVADPAVLDFDMLQTGHNDRASIPNTVESVIRSYEASPRMPVIVGEVCYEGIMEASRQEVQRFMFWTSMLNGAAGHTYGANGIWQVNTKAHPYGPSPHGRSWGDVPWDEAAALPGSRQVGMAKAFLSRYPWWRMEPHPEWVEPHFSAKSYNAAYAGGIPRELRILFVPPAWDPPMVKALESDVSYRALFFNPATGKETVIGPVTPDASGNWRPPVFPVYQDWVVVLQKL
jgi:hypothetical protein